MFRGILLSIGLGLLVLAVALLFLILNERRFRRRRLIEERQKALGLPFGELVYEDADGLGERLNSTLYPLVGKPDYVVKLPDGRLVPVELKLGVENAQAAYSNHILQVAAYCLILEDYSEQPPTHGIVRYSDREFIVEYTPALRKRLLRILTEMEQRSAEDPPQLKTQRATKCRSCTFQPICPIGHAK